MKQTNQTGEAGWWRKRERAAFVFRIIVSISMIILVLMPAGCRETSDVKGGLVIYTSVPENLIRQIETAFTRKYPDVKVTLYRDGTGKVMDRIYREMDDGGIGADVIWVADFTVGEELKAKGRLLKYQSPEAEKVIPILKDPDGYYCAARLLNMVLAYNTDHITTRPEKYTDILRPQYRDRVGLANPAYSGVALYAVGTLLQDSEYGWGFFDRLYGNGCRLPMGNGKLIDALAKGDLWMGLTIDFMVRGKISKNQGVPLDYVFPDDGGVLVPSPVAITKNSRNLPAAKAFVDFILSREGQQLLVAEGVAPVRLDIRPPKDIPSVMELKIINASPEAILANKYRILETFQRLFAGQETAGTRDNLITLYTSVPIEIIEEIQLDFEARHPGLYLEIYRTGTTRIMEKVEKELADGRVRADLIWIADFTRGEDLKKENALLQYTPPEADQLMDILKDRDGTYFAARLLNMVVAYNKEKVTRIPRDYRDLTDPVYRGRMGHASPETSGAFLYFMGTLLHDADYGESFFRDLAGNAPLIQNNSLTTAKIATGELDIGISIDYLVRDYLKSHPKAPIDYVYPENGVVLSPSPIAIFKDGPNVERAKIFEGYILSRSGQQLLRDLAGVVPVRLDLSPPDRIDSITQLQVLPSDQEWIREHRDHIISTFRNIYGPALEKDNGMK